MKKIETPVGMYGLAVEPWGANEIYAVAANWAQASSPVLVYGEDGWTHDEHGRQVADFRHNSRAALESIIREVIEMGGDEPDDDEVESILDDAAEIPGVESPKYKLRSTESGYSVVREDGDYAEFLDSDEADEAMKLLISGDKSEDDYEWVN